MKQMAYRTEIERALDEMTSEETGKKFQGIAVVHAKQKWPQLVACERNGDVGLDATISARRNERYVPDGHLDPGPALLVAACER